MPIIDVKVMEGVLTTEQKQTIARGFTDVFADVVGAAARPVTTVIVQDVPSGQLAIGGEILTTDGIKQMLKGELATV